MTDLTSFVRNKGPVQAHFPNGSPPFETYGEAIRQYARRGQGRIVDVNYTGSLTFHLEFGLLRLSGLKVKVRELKHLHRWDEGVSVTFSTQPYQRTQELLQLSYGVPLDVMTFTFPVL